jgi:hypothetical protein
VDHDRRDNKEAVPFGLTRGEILLIAFIFGLVYSAGLLPKVAARLSGTKKKKGGEAEAPRD